MRHHKANRKFGREKGQRDALMKSLARSLILKGKIQTTEARAKELRPFVEKLITRGKGKTLAARRTMSARLGDDAAKKLIENIAPGYKERAGGYIRIVKLPRRANDASKMAHIEFV